MFKQTMKNFFKSLRFIVIPMAFVYFGLLSFLILVVEGIVKAVANFSNALSTVIKSTSGEVTVQVNAVMEYFRTEKNFTSESIQNFFNNFINGMKGIGQESVQTLTSSGQYAAKVFIGYLVAAAIVFAVSFVLGIIITGISIRKDSGMKSNPGKFFLRLLFKILLIGLMVFVFWLLSKVNIWLSIVILLAYLIANTFFSFLFGYLLHKGKTHRGFFKTIKFKDILVYFLCTILFYIAAILLALGIMLLSGDIIIGFILIIPFLIVVSEFFSNSAEIYASGKIRALNEKEGIVEEKKPKAKKAKAE